MQPQFLTRADGSIPDSTDMQSLEAAGVLIVRPTVAPTAPPGKLVRDTSDPVLIDGIYYQRWELIDAPVAQTVRKITPIEFMNRLSLESQAGIVVACDQNAMAKLWLLRMLGAALIDLDSDDMKIGISTLQQAGILTQSEVAALIA